MSDCAHEARTPASLAKCSGSRMNRGASAFGPPLRCAPLTRSELYGGLPLEDFLQFVFLPGVKDAAPNDEMDLAGTLE